MALLLARSRFVNGELDATISGGHDLRHQRGVLRRNVVVVERNQVLEAKDILVPLHPYIHLPHLDVANAVVNLNDSDAFTWLIHLGEPWHEVTLKVVAVDECVERVPVGVNRSNSHKSILILQRVRLDRCLCPAPNCFIECPVHIIDLESDVSHEVAVDRQSLRNVVTWLHRC